MKPKNNNRWIRRKHRNGKRPGRKGHIRINLCKLSSTSEILDLRFKYNGLGLVNDMPKNPELDFKNWYGEENQRRIRQYQHDTEQWTMRHDQWRAFYDKLVRASKFLESFQQIAPVSLAGDAIKNTQIERIGSGDQLTDDRQIIAAAWQLPNN